MEIDSEEVLQNARLFLSKPDAIMEHNVPKNINNFIKHSGQDIEEMVRLFIHGYRGYGQMSNILLSWLQDFGQTEEELEILVKDQIKEKIAEKTGRSRCERIFESLKVDLTDTGDVEDDTKRSPDVVGYEKFHEAISNQLLIVLNCETEEEFQKELLKFCRMSCISELAYYKTRNFLYELDAEKNDLKLKFIMATLETHARKIGPTSILDIPACNIENNSGVRAIVEDLERTGTATTTDVGRMTTMDAQSIRQLQRDELYNYIIDIVFVPQKSTISTKHLKIYVSALLILSYGDSAENPQMVEVLLNLASLCQLKQFGSRFTSVPKFLIENLDDPLFAYGLVRWIHHTLSSVSYYRTAYESRCTPLFIQFLHSVADRHKLLRNHIFEVIWTVLTLQFPKEITSLEVMDLHERLIPLLTQLIHLGLCAKIFNQLGNNKIDGHILRQFLVMVCDSIKFPLPLEFLNPFCHFISLTKVTEAMRHHPKTKESVRLFLVDVPVFLRNKNLSKELLHMLHV